MAFLLLNKSREKLYPFEKRIAEIRIWQVMEEIYPPLKYIIFLRKKFFRKSMTGSDLPDYKTVEGLLLPGFTAISYTRSGHKRLPNVRIQMPFYIQNPAVCSYPDYLTSKRTFFYDSNRSEKN